MFPARPHRVHRPLPLQEERKKQKFELNYFLGAINTGRSNICTHSEAWPVREQVDQLQDTFISSTLTTQNKMPKCPKCQKEVYFAERVTSLGKDWHRPCLKCEKCSKTLSPGSHAEHNGKPYCHKPCYGALFGPGGYGHGGTESHTYK
uniref:Cysteine-rich protein 1 n=2 Tax=Amphiprion ocellaris TaxID=80972 RepID=A0A3Q1DD98_AMPOC